MTGASGIRSIGLQYVPLTHDTMAKKKSSGLLTAPTARWIDDIAALQRAASGARQAAGRAESAGHQDDANQLYQEAYACDRAAALIEALCDPTSPERADLHSVLLLAGAI